MMDTSSHKQCERVGACCAIGMLAPSRSLHKWKKGRRKRRAVSKPQPANGADDDAMEILGRLKDLGARIQLLILGRLGTSA